MRINLGAKHLIEMGQGACPKGMIWRKAYTRKVKGKKIHVPGGCIVDRGAPGKTPPEKRWAVFPKGKKEFLPGWEYDKPAEQRRAAIRADLRREDNNCLKVQRKLLQIRNVNKRTNPEVSRIAEADRKHLVAQPYCKLKGKKN